MKKIAVIALLLSFAALMSFRSKPPALFTVPDGWPKPVYNFKKNPLSEKKIELGRRLFYDPVLSQDSTISCASCHSSFNAFTHVDHNLSHGIQGKIGTRNSPALMNLAWGESFMWDGSVEDLNVQALKPITNPIEMNETIEHVVIKLNSAHKYRLSFYEAFGDSLITGPEVLKSLTQFMLTLVSNNARYDSVKRGETTFTPKEEHGYTLFQKNCSQCHTEPLFTNETFENNGLAVDTSLNDIGQMKVTNRSQDYLKFKVPTLRNIVLTYPYMHDGRFKTLGQVLNNYIRGIQHSPTLSPRLRSGIYLTPDEKADLLAFLQTLTDKAFITNPKFAYPTK